MMDLNKLRLGLSYIFFESKLLTKKSKIQLINFIENADIHQLKVLAMDGELIKKDILDEACRQIIDDRFDDSITEKINSAALKGLIELTNLKVDK